MTDERDAARRGLDDAGAIVVGRVSRRRNPPSAGVTVHGSQATCRFAANRGLRLRLTRPTHLISAGEQRFAQRKARRAMRSIAHRQSRKGALAGWPAVRVKPGARRQCRSRASARPRWPADAKPFLKNVGRFPRECCLPASHARHGESGDSSQRSKGGGGRRPTGDMSGEESPGEPCLHQKMRHGPPGQIIE